MNGKLVVMVFNLILLHVAFSQISENMDIFVTGGVSLPVESSIGKTFTFPQMDYSSNSDFASDVLGLTSDAANFEKYWKNGFNAGAGMNYRFNSYLSLITDFNFSHFEFDKNSMQQDIADAIENPAIVGVPFNENGLDIYQGAINIYELKINARVQYPFEHITPYMIAGGGYMRVNQDPIKINYYDEPSSDPNNPMTIAFYDEIPGMKENAAVLNAGAGILFKINKNLQPFVQVEYSLGLTKDQNTVTYPIRFGFNFSLK